MGQKISIYTGPPLDRLLTGHDGRSGRINAVADRYETIVRDDCPALTVGEWCAVADATKSTAISEDLSTGLALWMDVADAGRLEGLDETWGVDTATLAERLRTLPTGARVAVIEVLERLRRSNADTWEARLREAGARIK